MFFLGKVDFKAFIFFAALDSALYGKHTKSLSNEIDIAIVPMVDNPILFFAIFSRRSFCRDEIVWYNIDIRRILLSHVSE